MSIPGRVHMADPTLARARASAIDSNTHTKADERPALRPGSDCILICRVCKASTACRYLRHRASDGLEVRVTPEGTVQLVT